MNKKWEKPVLVSLYRGKVEEKVLCGCKLMSGGGPTEYHNHQCDKHHYGCSACSASVTS